jgi:biotin operon repressor
MTDTRKKKSSTSGNSGADSKKARGGKPAAGKSRRKHSGNADSGDPLDPQRIVKLFSKRDPQPLTKTQISRQLKLSPDDRSALRKVLRKMEEEGQLVKSRGERFVPV